MSVSRFLKKFGQTSLASPTTTDARSSPSTDEPPSRRQASEPTPSLPRPWRKKRPPESAIDHSVSPSLLTEAAGPPSEHGVRESSPQMPLPTSPNVFLATFSMEPPAERVQANNGVPNKLAVTWDAVKGDPKFECTNTTREFGIAEDEVNTMQNIAEPFNSTIEATIKAAQQSDMGKAIKEGVDKFSESMPIVMKALDELKSLHPFIGVVVLAFQTVYTLEQRRRDNDKKITSLFVEMRDMMGALFRLRGIKNDKIIAPDGISIEDRLKSLVDRTADEIKMCSNACDAYVKKTLLAKVLMSPVWDANFLGFVQLFATRRREFEFELMIHTSQGVDKANEKLDLIRDATRTLNEQMNVMKTLFQQFASPEQRRLSDLVAAKGGIKALKEDDKILVELENAAGRVTGSPKTEGGRMRQGQSKDIALAAKDLRREIFEDPNVAAEKNLLVFTRKFGAQKKQIIDEITLVVKRESDRVIQEVKGGPHERILDRTIHEIWTEMGWRGNVKARHFVLTLRDYYLEKLVSATDNVIDIGTTSVHCAPDPDAWAIKYIDITRLQPILEAIDDDASGFITIGEINRFTASRPVDWSLPHWVAFWADGYLTSVIDYAHKIDELFSKMDGVRTNVHPLNRHPIISYFNFNWEFVRSLVAPFLPLQPAQDDREIFKSYLEAEEARLEGTLRAVDYVIDGMDALALFTGVGRIEKTVFPLLYLLMKRHYEIMRIMRTKVLDSRELWDGINTMLYVRRAIAYRVEDLTINFSQQKLDVEKQFTNFAYGMFYYIYDPKSLWSRDLILNLEPSTTPYDDANEDQGVKVQDILRFEDLHEPSLDYWVYDGHSITDASSYGNVEPPLKDILGHWNGHFYESGGVRDTQGTDSMMTLVLEPAEGEQDLKVNGWSFRGRFTFTGSWAMGENDVMQVKLKMSHQIAFSIPIFFNGHFDPERDALTGVWGYSDELESSMGPVEFRRIPPRYLTVYPSIKELSDNKPRALWKFSIAAVRNDIRRQRCSWSYFAQRRDDREMVVSFVIRYLFFGKPLNEEEVQKLCAAIQRLTPADACFYGSIVDCKRAPVWTHGGVYCDSCSGFIGGARLTCIDCVNKDGDTFDTLDICCSPESRCIDERITYRMDLAAPHEPFHRLLKVRTAVLINHFGRTHKLACAAFERVEESLAKITAASTQPQEEETGQNVQNASDSTTMKDSSERDKQDDIVAEGDGSQGGTEAEPITTEILSHSDKSDDVTVTSAVNGIRDRIEAEPTTTEAPTKSDNVSIAMDDTRASDEAETEDKENKIPQTTAQAQGQDGDLPTCGACNGSLSFPLWYCIFCEDNLFICDGCDAKGVPDLMPRRSSGKHTEEHHLIRCLKPEKDDETDTSPDQRLISIEARLADMQTQFADIPTQFANIPSRSQFADIQGRFNDLATRIGNIEVLLHKLAGTTKSG